MLKLKLQYSGRLLWRADSLEKTLMLGKIGGKRSAEQRMRWSDGITDSTDMDWSKLWEMVKDRGGWCAAVLGIAKSQTWLSTEQQHCTWVRWLTQSRDPVNSTQVRERACCCWIESLTVRTPEVTEDTHTPARPSLWPVPHSVELLRQDTHVHVGESPILGSFWIREEPSVNRTCLPTASTHWAHSVQSPSPQNGQVFGNLPCVHFVLPTCYNTGSFTVS